MIGGQGQRVLLKIVAKHADMWNVPNASAERYADLLKVIERHGDTVGRDTDQIEKTIMMGLTYRASAEHEKAALGRIMAISGATPEQARRQMMIGSREECLETIDRYLKVGVTTLHLHAAAAVLSRRSSALCRRGDSRGALALARHDHDTVGSLGVGSVERRRDSGKRARIEIAFQLRQSSRNSGTLEPPKA